MISSSAYGELKIFSGSANPCLARKVCEYLNHPLENLIISRHSDGEIYVRYPQSIRGTDVFIIQPTHMPMENLQELLMLIDAASRASARRITAVIPYFGYARGDRKAEGRESIPAKLVADQIAAAGANRVLLLDLHASQIQGFFPLSVKTDHLYAKPVFVDYLRSFFQSLGFLPLDEHLAIMAPDAGAAKIGHSYAKKLDNVPLVIADKRRPSPNKTEVYTIIGDVKGKIILEVDDIVDTAGTLIKAAEAALECGAKEIYAVATHAVLSGNAVSRLETSPIKKLFVSDSIGLTAAKRNPKIEIISVASILGESIKRIHLDESISEQFD